MIPDQIADETQLNALLASPNDALVDFMRNLDGDLMVLGIAGKMGVSLGHLAVSAIQKAGVDKTVYGVARFSDPAARTTLDSIGVKTIQCDLLDRGAVAQLPPIPNLLFMAGRKFGTSGAQSLTWAMNTIVPANVAEKFRTSKIVVFSTGCVYPLVRSNEAANESVAPAPVGEYAQSCLGRERVFEYYSSAHETPVCLYRLNYAIDLRYGILFDIAEQIWNSQPVNNSVESFNVIWQGDANHQALMCLGHCESPPEALNVTGPEILSTENVAHQMGKLMNKEVLFSTTSGGRSYLSDSGKATALFGMPSLSADQLIRWQTHWVMAGGRSLNKPTHFEVNTGDY